jgi:HD-like signal output (HDOD) protein
MRTWGLPEELALAVRQHHGLELLDDAEMPLLARQLVALSTMANAALSGARADWERNRALVGRVVEAPEQQLQALFDELAALDPVRN